MNSMTHPDTEQLSDYLQEPAADRFSDIRLHLMQCHVCRSQASLISEIRNNLENIRAEQDANMSEQDSELAELIANQTIEQYVDDSLDPKTAVQVRKTIENNPRALKMALHYASHSASMSRQEDVGLRSTSRDVVTQSGSTQQQGIAGMFRQWISARIPLWMTVPVAAVAAGIFAVVILPQTTQFAQGPTVVAYQDNPTIQFRRMEPTPGIGFFANADKIVKPYQSATARVMDKDKLELVWPEVEGAVSYTLHVKIHRMGEYVSVDKITTKQNQAQFTRLQQDAGQRYVWSLSGKTQDGAMFSTKGGFVINN